MYRFIDSSLAQILRCCLKLLDTSNAMFSNLKMLHFSLRDSTNPVRFYVFE